MTPFEQSLGDGGKKKNPFNRKNPSAELGLGRGNHLPIFSSVTVNTVGLFLHIYRCKYLSVG